MAKKGMVLLTVGGALDRLRRLCDSSPHRDNIIFALKILSSPCTALTSGRHIGVDEAQPPLFDGRFRGSHGRADGRFSGLDYGLAAISAWDGLSGHNSIRPAKFAGCRRLGELSAPDERFATNKHAVDIKPCATDERSYGYAALSERPVLLEGYLVSRRTCAPVV